MPCAALWVRALTVIKMALCLCKVSYASDAKLEKHSRMCMSRIGIARD